MSEYTPRPETTRLGQEPGIERNEQGRIIATGWPLTPIDQYPQAYTELQNVLSDQILLEQLFVTNGIKVRTALVLGSGKFTVGEAALAPYLSEEISQRLTATGISKVIKVCDVGGGNGGLLESALYSWTAPHSRLRFQRKNVNTTLTTLMNHEPGLLDSRKDAIDYVVLGMGVELPRDDFYNTFDIIAAQNSIFFWTKYPEIALLNLYKLCSDGGVVFVTIPKVPIVVEGENSFDVERLLWENDLFMCQLLQERDEDILIKLVKK